MADAKVVLGKLRDPSADGASARLAALLVKDALGRTVNELLDVRFVAGALREGLRTFAASDAAAAWVTATLEEGEKTLAAEKRTLGALASPSLVEAAHELAALQVTPPREVVEKLLDREPLKKLLRAQVVDTLIAFGRRAASPVSDNRIARGLGGLSKLAMGNASKPSAFGALANAVSGEVERQVEKRATDFADTAVEGILEGLAVQLSDPARAKEQVAMRLALLDGFLELTGAEVAQLGRGPVADRVVVARKALGAWAAEESFEADWDALIATLLAKEGGRPLGDVLGDLGVKDVVAEKATELVRRKVALVVAGEPFAEWLGALLE
jgi:hypothetical protein